MKKIRIIEFIPMLMLLLLPLCSFGQLDTVMHSEGYYVKMNNTLNLRFDLDNDVRSFEFDSGNLSYSVLPNTNLRMAIAYNYRFLTFKVGFSPKFLAAGDTGEKGKTSVFRLSLDMFIKDFYQSFDYDQTKGYYIDGIEAGIPGPNAKQ